MGRAVEFDDEFRIDAIEVGDVGAEGMLAAKLHTAALAFAKELPEVVFGTVGRLSQIASEFDGVLATHAMLQLLLLSGSPVPGEKVRGWAGLRR